MESDDRIHAIRALSDDDVIAALAGAAGRDADPVVANVLATEALNRVSQARAIARHMADGLIALDDRGVITVANPAALRMVARDADSLVKRDAYEALAPLTREGRPIPRDQWAVTRAIDGTDFVENEYESFACAHEGRVMVEFTVTPIVQDRIVTGAVLVFRDATRRELADRMRSTRRAVAEIISHSKGAAEALPHIASALGRGMRARATFLWSNTPDAGAHVAASWIHENDRAAAAMARETGLLAAGADIPGAMWERLEPLGPVATCDLDAARFPRARAAREHGLTRLLAFPCISGNRVVATVECWDPDADRRRGVVSEATEVIGREIGAFIARTDAERARVEADARTRGILDAALDAVVSTDTKSRIIEWNPAAESLFGFSREEVLGRDVADIIIPKRFRAAHRLGMARYLETGEGPVLAQRLEMPALRRNRTEFTVEMYIVPVATHGGQVRLFTSYLRDATGRQDAARELAYHARLLNELCEMQASAVMVANAAGHVVCFNTKFAQLWPVPVEVLASADSEAILIWTSGLVEDTHAYLESLHAIRHDRTRGARHVYRLRDGRSIARTGRPVALESDKDYGWFWTFDEIPDATTADVHEQVNPAV